ncbi:MAG: VWA domain-containing protein [Thermoleophilia bacterium]|nr:VWA domain-containing protein [Thermoleophilia bacterium]
MPRRQLAMMLSIMAALAALFAFNPGAAAGATCVPATNIEAIIDDSGSMSYTDVAKNRVEGLKILISKSGNAKKTLGALEFGSAGFDPTTDPAATTLFPPEPIGPNATAMGAALDANIGANNGATDYNAAFDKAKVDNPNANARIFLTDGGHNEGTYNNGHQGGPPTYVIGLDVTSPDDIARLQAIANDTGGKYFPDVTTANLNSTMNQVDAALNCQSIGNTYTDSFTKQGQSKPHSTSIRRSTRSIDLVLSWGDPLNQFTIGSIRLRTSNGATVSVAKRHLRIKRTVGKTFLSVHVSGLKRGKLRFKLRAKTLGSALASSGVQLTTQATQSRRR